MKKTIIEAHKSSIGGLQANIAVLVMFIAMAVVSWIWLLGWVAWVVPLVFFFMEKESKFVKFEAVQALVLGIVNAVIQIIFKIFYWILLPRDWYSSLRYLNGGFGTFAIFSALATIVSIIFSLIVLYVVYQAFRWKQIELPVIGPIAEKTSARLNAMK
ncbi:MAG: hypothetical protein FWC55_05605 [Firmicutes bacterium]|nr:hypothetical protein [Bacillota bacterium]